MARGQAIIAPSGGTGVPPLPHGGPTSLERGICAGLARDHPGGQNFKMKVDDRRRVSEGHGLENFETYGFALVRDVFSPGEIDELREETNRVAGEAGSTCVRHIRGRSPVFARLAAGPRLGALLDPGMRPVRSILFDKTPEENWPVAWHQDLTIAVEARVEIEGYGPWSHKDGAVHVQPPVTVLASMVAARIHLDDTPEGNGALRVVPGSHTRGRLSAASVREADDEVICACGAGDVVLMSLLLLHSSKRSLLPSRRRVLHFEFAPAGVLDSRLSWHEKEAEVFQK